MYAKNILIVEDDDTWQTIYTNHISGKDFTVAIARNYGEAVSLIQKRFFHAAIVDKRLIDSDPKNEQGIDILERFSEAGEKTGLILITAYPSDESLKKAYEKFHIISFINKENYDRHELAKALDKAIEVSTSQLETIGNETVMKENLIKLFAPLQLHTLPFLESDNPAIELLASVIRPLSPVKTSGSSGRIENIERYVIAETSLWSRNLGKAVKIRIGHRKEILKEVNDYKNSESDFFVYTKGGVSVLRIVLDDREPASFPYNLKE